MSFLESKYILYFPLIMFLILLNCGSSGSFDEGTETGLFSSAKKEFEDNDYYNSRRKFETFTRLYPGSSVIDSAQFFLGESYFGLKEYISASSEYQNLIRNYPNSVLADDAQYKIALSYYKLSPDYALDQQYTTKAIDEFITLLEDYPTSSYIEDAMKKRTELMNKLAKKSFKNGEQYRKLGEYVAAKKYFGDILEYYGDTEWTPEALYSIGECELKLENFESARIVFEEFIKSYPKHSLVEEAKLKLQKLTVEKSVSDKMK